MKTRKTEVVILLRKQYLAVLFIFIVMIFAGCGNKEPRQQEVRIAHFANLTHAQALVGKANGSFEKAFGNETKVRWMEFNAGFSEIEALLAGEVDIGYIGPGPAIGGYLKSKGGLQIIAGAVNGGAILVAGPDARINSAEDLKGKKVAIPQLGNTQDLVLRELLRKNGLKSTANGGTVDILQAENSDIKTYLARGYIDAALLPEPWGSRLIREVDARLVLDYDELLLDGKYPTSVVIVRREFLERHPDLVEKFLETHIEITREIQRDPETAKRLINGEIKKSLGKSLDSAILDEAFKRLVVTYTPEKKGIEEFVHILVRSDYLRNKPDTGNLVNSGPVNKALRSHAKEEQS